MLATDHENGTLSLIEELEAFYDTSQPSGADTAQIMGRPPFSAMDLAVASKTPEQCTEG